MAADPKPIVRLARVSVSEEQGSPDDVTTLLDRMRSGDRVAAALFVTRYSSRIRRRIRGKLKPEVRRDFDSEDILSTLGRRLDELVSLRRLEASNNEQLWALAFRIAEHAVQEKARAVRRRRNRECRAIRVAEKASSREHTKLNPDVAGGRLQGVMDRLKDSTDRQILSLRIVGVSWKAIAVAVGMTPAAARKRWQRMKRVLQSRLWQEAD